MRWEDVEWVHLVLRLAFKKAVLELRLVENKRRFLEFGEEILSCEKRLCSLRLVVSLVGLFFFFFFLLLLLLLLVLVFLLLGP